MSIIVIVPNDFFCYFQFNAFFGCRITLDRSNEIDTKQRNDWTGKYYMGEMQEQKILIHYLKYKILPCANDSKSFFVAYKRGLSEHFEKKC